MSAFEDRAAREDEEDRLAAQAPTDHMRSAAAFADRADHYANADSIRDHGLREHMVSYNLRMAQVHATIAVAQRLDTMIGLVFDDARAIHVVDANDVGL